MTTQPTPMPTSRAQHREQVRAGQVTVRMTRKIKVEQEIDVVGFFRDLTPAEQHEYRTVDYLAEHGYSAVWEKPLAFLASRAEVNADTMLGVSVHVVERFDDEYDDADRVTHRNGLYQEGRDSGRWTVADYEALVALVPWMDPEIDVTPERLADIARQAGPNDVPFEGLEAM